MAQGLELEWDEKPRVKHTEERKTSGRPVRKNVEGRAMGSRRIFAPHFKLKVLDSYRQDSDCRGNQRATARKYGIHRRQIQKWLQVEASLRTTVELGPAGPASLDPPALNLCGAARLRDDIASATAGESQATSQRGSIAADKNQALIHLVASPHVDDAIRPSDNQEVKKEVTITLFPSVKIEQLVVKPDSISSPTDDTATNCTSTEVLPHLKIEDVDDTHDPDLSVDDMKEEPMSEDDDMLPPVEMEQALDFTCAALSKRRSFSLQFKLEVLDAFHSDRQCHGNQRATARKFGINRRQVQKWLHQEVELRGETIVRGGLYRQRLGRWIDSAETTQTEENSGPSKISCTGSSEIELPVNCTMETDRQESSPKSCWDLSSKKRKAEPSTNVAPYKKRPLELLKRQNDDCEDVTSSAENDLPEIQETALCLVKVKQVPNEINLFEHKFSSNHSEVSSTADLNRVVGQALYHSNRDHIIPPYVPLPIPPHNFFCFPHQGLHHMLNQYRGFVIHR